MDELIWALKLLLRGVRIDVKLQKVILKKGKSQSEILVAGRVKMTRFEGRTHFPLLHVCQMSNDAVAYNLQLEKVNLNISKMLTSMLPFLFCTGEYSYRMTKI